MVGILKTKSVYWIIFFIIAGLIFAVHSIIAQKVSTSVSIYSDIFLTEEGLLPLPENAVELELNFSFISDLFQAPGKLDRDKEGNIYILDTAAAKIFKFDPMGTFLQLIGGGQRGSVRLLQPENFLISKDRLVIHDSKQNWILFSDLNGLYLNRIKLSGFNDFDIDNEGNCYLAMQVQYVKSPLINIVYSQGHSTSSFGKPIRFHHSMEVLNKASIAVKDGKEIFIAFRYFPLVRKYGLDHTLLNEFLIDTPVMEAKDRYNLQLIGRSIADPSFRGGYMDVITDIEIHQGQVFILSYHPRLEIIRLAEDVAASVTYWLDEAEVYAALDFCVSEFEGELRFFVLRAAPPLYRVDVFKIKERSNNSGGNERIDELTKTIESNPTYIPAYINRGIEKYNKGDFEGAAGDFSEVTERDPKNVAAWFNRGNVWMKLKRYERAIKDFEKAIEMDVDHSAAYFNLGLALIYKKKYLEAIATFERAAELDPQLKNKAAEQIRFCRRLMIRKQQMEGNDV